MALTIDRWMSQGLPTALSREMQLNLGGELTTNLSTTNHTVTVPDEVQCVRHIIVGALSVSRTYTFPAVSGFFFVDNQTTGNQITFLAVTGGNSVKSAPGQKLLIFVSAFFLTVEIIGDGGGGASGNTATITVTDSPYNVPATIDFVAVDTTGGNVSVILPPAATYPGRSIGIVKTVDAHVVNITTLGGLINGGANYPLNSIGESILPNSNSIDWWSF